MKLPAIFKNRNGGVGTYVLFLLVGLLLGAILGGELMRRYHSPGVAGRDSTPNPPVRPFVEPASDPGDTVSQTDGVRDSRQNAIVAATREAAPSVVGIVVTAQKYVGESYYYEDFFDLFYGPRPAPRYKEVKGMGSGVIISKDGLILTNNHVVQGAGKLVVNFSDGRQIPGTVIGQDPQADLALIRVDADNLKAAKLGSSDDIVIGEWVLAIGNPFLYIFDPNPTVTVGVVSALNRNFMPVEDVYYQDMIQTDAAINPGNSGGPLVNAVGEVIGINSFIYTDNKQNKGWIGIGFAIPIERAKKVVDELLEHGRRRPVWTGISVQDLDRSTALAKGYDKLDGVIVTDVLEGSPGDEAGIRVGDIIVRMGNRRIHSHSDIEGIFLNYFVGDQIGMEIVRNKRKLSISLDLEEYPTSFD